MTTTPNSLSAASSLVWFITGTSQGFGNELVRVALQRGDSVVATSRQPERVAALFPEFAERLLAISLDLRDEASVAAGIGKAIERFGRIDVLVNNAGHGLLGAIEEASDAEIASVYETNVFGLLRVTRAVLPHMRAEGRGHVVNLSSIGGLVGLPGCGRIRAPDPARAHALCRHSVHSKLVCRVAPDCGLRLADVRPSPVPRQCWFETRDKIHGENG